MTNDIRSNDAFMSLLERFAGENIRIGWLEARKVISVNSEYEKKELERFKKYSQQTGEKIIAYKRSYMND